MCSSCVCSAFGWHGAGARQEVEPFWMSRSAQDAEKFESFWPECWHMLPPSGVSIAAPVVGQGDGNGIMPVASCPEPDVELLIQELRCENRFLFPNRRAAKSTSMAQRLHKHARGKQAASTGARHVVGLAGWAHLPLTAWRAEVWFDGFVFSCWLSYLGSKLRFRVTPFMPAVCRSRSPCWTGSFGWSSGTRCPRASSSASSATWRRSSGPRCRCRCRGIFFYVYLASLPLALVCARRINLASCYTAVL